MFAFRNGDDGGGTGQGSGGHKKTEGIAREALTDYGPRLFSVICSSCTCLAVELFHKVLIYHAFNHITAFGLEPFSVIP